MSSKSLFSLALAALMTACGAASVNESAIRDSTANSVAFSGAMAEKLTLSMARQPGVQVTSAGYSLRGLNTSVSCTFDYVCTIAGPSISAGQLTIDLGTYSVPANSNVRPIQLRLFDAVRDVSDTSIGSSTYASHSICQIVSRAGTYPRCDPSGDELRVSISREVGNVNAPTLYSAKFVLVP